MINKSIPGTLFFSMAVTMILLGCKENRLVPGKAPVDTISIKPAIDDSFPSSTVKDAPIPGNERRINGTVSPDSIVSFARTLIGVPYLYASTDPVKGFDCSGFITYVFNHFNISVPRSSVDFTDYGSAISIEKARPGDLVLFTGTDSTVRIVGHMGIVENVQGDKLYFIHSTSGKGKGVVITAFENYYQSRFVKMIRVFPDELFR